MATFYPTTNDCQVVKVTSWTGSGTSKRVSAYDAISGLNAQKYYFPIINEENITPVFGAWNATYAQYANSVVVAKTARDSATQKFYIYDTESYPGKLESVKSIFGSSSLYHAILMGNGSSAGEAASVMELIQQFLFTNFGCTIESSYTTLDAGTYRYFMDVTTHIGYEIGGNLKTSGSGHWYEWDLPIVVISGSTTRICHLRMEGSPTGNNLVYFTIKRENSWDAYPAITYDPYTPPSPSDPYPNIPDSAPEGGSGSGDFTGDTISEPSLPSKSAMGSGLVQLYNPTVSQLRSFGQWLWNANGFDLNDLKRVFNDPMDMIIGLSIFPVTPTVSGTPDTIKLGNIDSEVSSNVLSSQFKRIDLGTINLEEVYGSYLDYAPYTKVQIFLPFIGIRDLDCDDVMGKAIHLTYSIDMLSGACVAHVLVNGSTMYEYGGSCNEQVPLTARDLTTIFSGIASVVATGAGAVAAISAGIAALPAEASAGAVIGTAGVGVTGAGASIARNVISSKPSVEHASGIGGTTGYLSCKKPFLIVQRPRLCHPENQEHFTGYPGFIYVSSLSQLTGFTKMVNVELTRIHATDAELEEIAEWLMSKGVRI